MCNFYRLDDLLGQLEEMGDLVMTGHHNGKHIMHPITSFPAESLAELKEDHKWENDLASLFSFLRDPQKNILTNMDTLEYRDRRQDVEQEMEGK